jgi:hypothetical protein
MDIVHMGGEGWMEVCRPMTKRIAIAFGIVFGVLVVILAGMVRAFLGKRGGRC